MINKNKRIPVHILTGFLGSGKTTLLREYIEQGSAHRTAFIINEVGDIGIDHHLTQRLDGETLLLESGCLCCEVRNDLKASLLALLNQDTNEHLEQIIIETTGLANPAPILATIFNDRELSQAVVKGKIVTTVDALTAEQCARDIPEWANQLSSADSLIFTKTEKLSESDIHRLQNLCSATNPFASFYIKHPNNTATLAQAIHSTTPPRLLQATHEQPAYFSIRSIANHSAIQTEAINVESVDWQRFSIWLSMILYRYNDQILRVKGILKDSNTGNYVLLNSVRKILAPLEIIDKETLNSPSLGLVFITRGLTPNDITASFNAFDISPN
jgi:G3E family GTPase